MPLVSTIIATSSITKKAKHRGTELLLAFSLAFLPVLSRFSSRSLHVVSAISTDRSIIKNHVDDVPPRTDLMMGVVFLAIEGARRAGVANLDEPIVTEEADAFKDW